MTNVSSEFLASRLEKINSILSNTIYQLTEEQATNAVLRARNQQLEKILFAIGEQIAVVASPKKQRRQPPTRAKPARKNEERVEFSVLEKEAKRIWGNRWSGQFCATHNYKPYTITYWKKRGTVPKEAVSKLERT